MDSAEQLRKYQEEMWVLRAQQRDPDAFRRLVDAYEKRLLYFIRRYANNSEDALDVLQDVWLIAFQRLPALRSPAAFRVWLYQIAHDRSVSLVRGQRRDARVVEAFSDGQDADPEEAKLAFDDAELVHRLLGMLSLDHQEVLTLYFLEELPVEEIADILRCPAGTVKSRLHYAKKTLRSRMEKQTNG
jgi:RNA polymerase sigma-70 factor (ECF subfamily)